MFDRAERLEGAWGLAPLKEYECADLGVVERSCGSGGWGMVDEIDKMGLIMRRGD